MAFRRRNSASALQGSLSSAKSDRSDRNLPGRFVAAFPVLDKSWWKD